MTALLMPSLPPLQTPKAAGAHAIALRPIRAGDAPALQAFVRTLSPSSRRLRFHAAISELSEAALQYLTRVDQRAHVAFVLVTRDRAIERIIGEARYVVSDDPETAEFAIAVADECRGLGLAERLLAALVDAARAAGLRWLVGDVLADNARMLAFVRRCGFAETTRGAEPGQIRVERSIERRWSSAAAAGSWSGAARRVRRLLDLLPSSGEAALDFRPF